LPGAVAFAQVDGVAGRVATVAGDQNIDDAVAVEVRHRDRPAEGRESRMERLEAPGIRLALVAVSDAQTIAVGAEDVQLAILIEIVDQTDLAAGKGQQRRLVARRARLFLRVDPGEATLAVIASGGTDVTVPGDEQVERAVAVEVGQGHAAQPEIRL